MATELEKLLQTALEKALSDSTSGLTSVLKSFNGLSDRVEVLQSQVLTLNAQQEAALKREQDLIRLCNGLATQLETLTTKLNKIER